MDIPQLLLVTIALLPVYQNLPHRLQSLRIYQASWHKEGVATCFPTTSCSESEAESNNINACISLWKDHIIDSFLLQILVYSIKSGCLFNYAAE